MNTITASDFTVEMDISGEMWEFYLKQVYIPKVEEGNQREPDGSKYSQALYLKKHLTLELNRIMTEARAHRQEAIRKLSQSG
jgi:hypothetical protein